MDILHFVSYKMYPNPLRIADIDIYIPTLQQSTFINLHVQYCKNKPKADNVLTPAAKAFFLVSPKIGNPQAWRCFLSVFRVTVDVTNDNKNKNEDNHSGWYTNTECLWVQWCKYFHELNIPSFSKWKFSQYYIAQMKNIHYLFDITSK